MNYSGIITWSLSGISDFSWVDHIQLFYTGSDPQNPGRVVFLTQIPLTNTTGGTISFAQSGLAPVTLISLPHFSIPIFARIVSSNTDYVDSSALAIYEGGFGTKTNLSYTL